MIADSDIQEDYNSLRGFTAHMALTADQLQWRGMTFTQVKSDISNQLGLLTINQLQGELDGGLISLPGTLDARERHRKPLSSPNWITLRLPPS